MVSGDCFIYRHLSLEHPVFRNTGISRQGPNIQISNLHVLDKTNEPGALSNKSRAQSL